MNAPAVERRRFQRIATDKCVELEIDGQRYVGSVVDISLRGLLIVCARANRLTRGDAAHARVSLDDDSLCIEVAGEIIHVDERQVGLRCTQMGLESAARLRRLVELNLADSALLERELNELLTDQRD